MEISNILIAARKIFITFIYMITKGFNYYHFYK
jgi:hypothetical protein